MTKNETATGWIVFDRVEIDLSGRRLFVAGAETPLEPKAFAVLALLARNPGRAFARDDILDAVWGHRHVTPGVLNRVITLLRQALGESAEATQYLHTLHGVGYRFDSATQVLATRPVAGLMVDGDDAPPARQRPASLPSAALDAESTADSNALHEAATSTPADATTDTITRKPVRRRLAGLAALLACVLVGAGYLLRPPPLHAPASSLPTLVVLPLHPVGTTPDESVLADGLSEELITRLARIDGLRLISRTSASLAQAQNFDFDQLAQRLHVSHALEGSLRQSAQQLRIDLRLIEIPSGRTLWAQDYDRSLADVFAIQSEIAKSVAATLTLKLGLGGAAREPDPQLFRDYLQLWHRLSQHPDAPEYQQLTVSLRALVARAPDYARAHGLLARTLVQDLRATTISETETAEAAREAARALELDPDQVEARAALAAIACRATEWARCMDESRRVVELAPADSISRAAYGRGLASIGYLAQALEQTEIGVASDPLNYEANLFRARVLDTLGRHDEARVAFDAAAHLPAGTPARLAYARWYNAIWRHDLAAAREFADRMPADEHFRESYVGATGALADPQRWPQVEPLIETSERATGRYNFLRLLQPEPDLPKIIGALETVLKTGSSTYNLLFWNPEYVALRRDPAFQDFLRRTHIIDYWRSNGWPAQCHPEGERAVCE
ncbi:MAG TPA: winged helix-turn-helix domain-containing protein [Rudaea sp.]|nr:winged helix-turn-helix domain-containing protein [Rudaea sp.]